MSPAALEQLIRDRLQARDKTIAGHMFRSDTYQAATDRFVAEIVAAVTGDGKPAGAQQNQTSSGSARRQRKAPAATGLAPSNSVTLAGEFGWTSVEVT